MSEEPLLAKEVEDKTKLLLKYAKNNKKDLDTMEAAMRLAGHYTEEFQKLRDSQ